MPVQVYITFLFDKQIIRLRHTYQKSGFLSFAYGYTAAVNNVGIESMNIRCPQCSEANNLLGVTFLNGSNVADCVKCRAAIKVRFNYF